MSSKEPLRPGKKSGNFCEIQTPLKDRFKTAPLRAVNQASAQTLRWWIDASTLSQNKARERGAEIAVSTASCHLTTLSPQMAAIIS